ncbi:exodeoxyribonuclease VII large subunit [Varunaivibrio sulfuroxidans]|nr:exodeoxyribonuclease VII large subunit [Varunaivibrio sulfuroxidans]WES30124.1 exodeoxyribonuclease VII large subunit [Varunaivibrio sulfuroxidans]
MNDIDHNLPVLSVGEISQDLKRTVEAAFSRVRVRGEISGFKRAPSGHLYMALKDEDAVIDAVCWRATVGRLSLGPEDGMEVIATGRLTTYPGRSKYQIVIEAMELAGEGALLKMLEARKKKLAAEGLFDADAKRPIPFIPEVIGVVTSPTGAVIRDILHRLADRFPRRVLVWPVQVQGEAAAAQIAAAIDGFSAIDAGGPVPRPDVLIVARGGGSLEDLWPFNEEIVVRAAANSTIPLISAVGHETDTTLIDHAADRRAPTPSAAAEMAVPVRADLIAQVMDDGGRLAMALGRGLKERRLRLKAVAHGLPKLDIIAENARQRLDDWSERLARALGGGAARRRARLDGLAARLRPPRHQIGWGRERLARFAAALQTAIGHAGEARRRQLTHAARLLESYSYRNVLGRGFALVRGPEDTPVFAAKGVAPGTPLTLEFHDGKIGAIAAKSIPTPGGDGAAKRAKRKKKTTPDQALPRQGNLL